MGISLTSNMMALQVQHELANANAQIDLALERLSTGYKINTAKDNAAGYKISTEMQTKISALEVVEQNISLGLDFVDTASACLELIGTHLARLKDLAVQAQNGVYSEDALEAIELEANVRFEEINRLLETSEYNGVNFFNCALTQENRRVGLDKESSTEIELSGEAFVTAGDYLGTVVSFDTTSKTINVVDKSGAVVDSETFYDTSTFKSLLNFAIRNGMTATLNNGVISIDSVAGLYLEDAGANGVIEQLGISTSYIGASTSTVGTSVTSDIDLTYAETVVVQGTVELGEVVDFSAGDKVIAIRDTNGVRATETFSSSSTFADLLSFLNTNGTTATLNDGVLSITSTQGCWATDESSNGVLEQLGIAISNASSTQTIPASVTSSAPIYYGSASMADENSTLGDVTGLSGSKNVMIYDASGAFIASQAFTGDSRISDLLLFMNSNGMTASITDGIISVSSADGYYVSDHTAGGYIDAMGLTPVSHDNDIIKGTSVTSSGKLSVTIKTTTITAMSARADDVVQTDRVIRRLRWCWDSAPIIDVEVGDTFDDVEAKILAAGIDSIQWSHNMYTRDYLMTLTVNGTTLVGYNTIEEMYVYDNGDTEYGLGFFIQANEEGRLDDNGSVLKIGFDVTYTQGATTTDDLSTPYTLKAGTTYQDFLDHLENDLGWESFELVDKFGTDGWYSVLYATKDGQRYRLDQCNLQVTETSTTTTKTTATGSHNLSLLGLTTEQYVTVVNNGSTTVITATSSTSIANLRGYLQDAGLTASFSSGKLTVAGDDDTYILGMSDNLRTALKLGNNFSTQTTVTTYTNGDSNYLQAGGVSTITETNTFADIGISTAQNVTIYNNGTSHTLTINSSDSIANFITSLSAKGITATLQDGEFTLSSIDNSTYITGMSSDLKTALKLDGNFYTTTSSSESSNLPSPKIELETTTTIVQNTTFAKLGLVDSETVIVNKNGVEKTITVKPTTTLSNFVNNLNTQGINSSLTDGRLTLSGNGASYIVSISSNLETCLGLHGPYSTTSSFDLYDNTDSSVLKKSVNSLLLKSHNLSDLGILTDQTITVKKADLSEETLTFSSTSTMDDVIKSLGRAGVRAELAGGKFSLGGGKLTYVSSISADLMSALNLSGDFSQEKLVTVGFGANEIAIQVGMYADEYSRINIDTAFALPELENLMLSGIQDENAIDILNDLTTRFYQKQAMFGAYSNRLESALESAITNQETLISSLSTIKDADIPQEATFFLKAQIRQAACQTLLSTANQNPALALQLINGSVR